MHMVEAKGILSAHNGMNIYRGCLHGCIYCDSRSKCYNMNHKFEDIEIKINAPQLLEKALCSKRKKCMIGTGAMTDPYIPIENDLKIMRQCLEIIDKYGFGATIHTKSIRALRDIDLLDHINRQSKAVVQTTLTTFDESLCKIIEPNVSTTKERVEMLEICKEHNIPTVVWLSPFLPYLNDTEENINGLLDYCIQANVKGIICFGIGLTLRDGNREYFYSKLDSHFPGLKEKYISDFGNSYEIASSNSPRLMKTIYERCKKENIICGPSEVFEYLHTFEEKPNINQLSLFDI